MTLCENDGYMQWVTNNVKTLVVGEKTWWLVYIVAKYMKRLGLAVHTIV